MVTSPAPSFAENCWRKFQRTNAELKRHPQLWEAGEVHDLIGRILGQQHTGQTTCGEKCIRRPKNSVVSELVPSQPEGRSAKP